jgi:Flp pilus assembly pilin Flp
MSSELQCVRALIVIVRGRAARARREGRNELGASALEWAIISAIIAGLAIFVANTIFDKVSGKAEEIDVG